MKKIKNIKKVVTDEDVLKTFEPIQDMRRKQAKAMLKQLVVIAVLFALFTHVFAVENWMLAILYSILSIMAIGFTILTFKVIRYVHKNESK